MDMQVPQIAMPYSEEQIAAMREALAQNEAETAALKEKVEEARADKQSFNGSMASSAGQGKAFPKERP
ncbi:hypothetical protein WJX82_003189 [Trebouxia sp. C0006]